MPSLRHAAYARLVPWRRKARDLTPAELADPDIERTRLVAWHDRMDRALPTGRVRRFDERYDLTTTTEPFPVHTITPRGRTPRTTVYYLHGGGFVGPTDAWHVRWATRLGDHLDADVVVPDYPLTPEHTVHDSLVALVDGLAALTERQERVVVVGDSAGGGLALAVTMGLRDRGGVLPSELVLISPFVDLTMSAPGTAELDAVDPWLFINKIVAYSEWWAGGADRLGEVEASPALGDLAGLPPALMFCGTRDLLVPGCRLLADRAAAAGWPLTYVEEPGLIHVYPLLPGLPEAARAWRRTKEFLA